MKRIYIIPITSFLLCIVILSVLNYFNIIGIYEFYAKNMRVPLFTGFLTIGGFLLSLKTFVLIKLKEGLYEHPLYKERLNEMRHLNPNISSYGPLKRLGTFLVYCVFGSFLTSVIQFTLGVIECDCLAAFCISVSVGTMSVVFLAWWEIRKNLNEWFSILEKHDQNERHV